MPLNVAWVPLLACVAFKGDTWILVDKSPSRHQTRRKSECGALESPARITPEIRRYVQVKADGPPPTFLL